MKKSRRSKKLRNLYWIVAALVAAWLIFVPPSVHRHHAPVSVTVPVTQAPPRPTPEAEAPPAPESTSGPEAEAPVAPVPEPETPPTEPLKGGPKIALVIDDVGIDLHGSEQAIQLPAAVTLSFLPYASRLRAQTQEARDQGHELLLHMPMEPIGGQDPGPGALLTELPMPDLRQRFETALASFAGFDGVNNHMGSKFTAWPDGMAMVMDELKQRGLFYFDSRTSAQSVGADTARRAHLPTVSRDVFLDDDQSAAAITTQLDALERVARRKGSAVAIGHPHATTMAILPGWIAHARQQGFTFVPLRDLVVR